QPELLECNIVVNQDVSCNGGNDGSATVSGTGGVSPYTYAWPDGSSGTRNNNLSAGTYEVTITDANLCESTCTVTINEPEFEVSCSIVKNQDATCHGCADGSATVSGIGGTTPYSYKWPDNSTDATND